MDLTIERVKAQIAAHKQQRDFHRQQAMLRDGAIQALEELLEEPAASPNGKAQEAEAVTTAGA